MSNLEKIAYFNTPKPRKQENADVQQFLRMQAQKRKNEAELRNYRPLSWATKVGTFAPITALLWKVNPWLAAGTGLVASWLSGRVLDDVTGRTKLKQELSYINDTLDAHDRWRQLSRDYSDENMGSPWQSVGKSKDGAYTPHYADLNPIYKNKYEDEY